MVSWAKAVSSNLCIGDSWYSDNSGEVAVQIDVNCETENECVVPKVGTVGVDQTFDSNYIVCRADEQSAWVAHNDAGGNHYNALQICQSLGYSTVTAWWGTCGTICGYCNNQWNEYYDGAGFENINNLFYTVHRRCEGFSDICVDQPDPYCGDGIVNQESEQCDNGHGLDMAFVKVSMEEWYCNDQCQWEEVYEPSCGNGILDEGEQCDDGNENDTDNCTNACKIRSGGSASSVGWSTPAPARLLETGPEDGEDEGNVPTEATPETVIAACEEDTYILERHRKLSRQSLEIVEVIPSKYARKLWTKPIKLTTQLMQALRKIILTRFEYL
jgi:cysteine-rich repeat protein